MKRLTLFSLLLIVVMAFSACAPEAAAPAPTATPEPAPTSTPEPTAVPEPEVGDIVDTAVAAGSFNTLVAAVTAAELVETLKGEGPFTVFAPTDDAFAALGSTVDTLLEDPKGDLTNILLYHVIVGAKVMSSDLQDGMMVEMANGSMATISLGDGAMIDGANIVTADIETSNGVIHVIDAVIVPVAEEAAVMADIVDTAVAAGSFNTLVAAVTAAELVETLKGDGPFTVFAPTDDAFAALGSTVDALLADPKGDLTNILLYHVIVGAKVMSSDLQDGMMVEMANGSMATISLGDGAMIDGANIVTADIETSNGVIHVIDAVIVPVAEEAAVMADIVDTAVAAGSFNTLVAAVTAAELVETLKGDGPFTVFAPTDDAFAALGSTVDALLADPKGDLTNILLYHVIVGAKVMSSDLQDGMMVEMANGSMATISLGDGAMIDGANIVTADIEASNGVIHVIDAVIVPVAE